MHSLLSHSLFQTWGIIWNLNGSSTKNGTKHKFYLALYKMYTCEPWIITYEIKGTVNIQREKTMLGKSTHRFTIELDRTRRKASEICFRPPPPPPRHWLPHVLKIMPRNPKYDQFQSKGHHNEENSQSMTKIPKFDRFHEVKILPKLEK